MQIRGYPLVQLHGEVDGGLVSAGVGGVIHDALHGGPGRGKGRLTVYIVTDGDCSPTWSGM